MIPSIYLVQVGFQGVEVSFLINFFSDPGTAGKAFKIPSEVILDGTETAIGLFNLIVYESQMLTHYLNHTIYAPGPS